MLDQSYCSENITPRLPESLHSVHLRVMQPEDKHAVMVILDSIPEFKPVEVMIAEEVIDSFLNLGSASGYRVWVAVEGTDKIIGYICFGQAPLTEGTWDIYWIAVVVTWRGRGVGRALLRHAEEEIRGEGGRMVLIETSSTLGYQQARMFYGRMGYLPVSVITDFYAPGDSKLTLQKLLLF